MSSLVLFPFQNREEQIVKEMSMRFKKDLAEYEAQVQAYKVQY